MNRIVALVALMLMVTSCAAMRPDAVDQPSAGSGPLTTSVGTSDTVAGVALDDIGLAAGDHVFALTQGRRDRSYRVHVPAQSMVPAPVVIALHGGGGTGEQFQTDNGMDAIADREGFVMVYPEGTGVLPNRLHTWNSGLNCCGYSLDRDIDDVGFLRMVINDLDQQMTIDRGRVYMTGHSNGAMMAYRFAAEAPEMVTAIVPVAGALSVELAELDQRVALLHIHSADDPRALYEGGVGPPFPGTERTHVAEPVVEGIELWAQANRCEMATPVQQTTIATDTKAQQRAELSTWDCPVSTPVQHLRLSGTGHGWPGVTVPRLWQRQLGPETDLISASEEVWAFVSQFSR